MSERLALYTTWYPGVEPYLAAWHRSVVAQTDRDFDVWVGVDALDGGPLAAALGPGPSLSLLPQPSGSSPARVRGNAIAALLDRYPGIVFVDSDDLLEPTRIAAARRALESADVAACALRIIDGEGRDLGVVFGDDRPADWSDFLPRYNVFGFSNSAYRTSVLRRCLPLGSESPLVDWLLATRAWALGARLDFDRTPLMAYRQYAANIARVMPPFSEGEVRAATARVLDHYRAALETPEWSMPPAPAEALGRANRRVADFAEAIHRSPATLRRYTEALNALPPRYVWWWLVAHPDLENVWKN